MQKGKENIDGAGTFSVKSHRAESRPFFQGRSPQNTKYYQTNPFPHRQLFYNHNGLFSSRTKPLQKTNPFSMATLPFRRLHRVKVNQGRSTGGRIRSLSQRSNDIMPATLNHTRPARSVLDKEAAVTYLCY